MIIFFRLREKLGLGENNPQSFPRLKNEITHVNGEKELQLYQSMTLSKDRTSVSLQEVMKYSFSYIFAFIKKLES